ncbi:fibroblast growth factor 16-like [Glandiceps talaboti]
MKTLVFTVIVAKLCFGHSFSPKTLDVTSQKPRVISNDVNEINNSGDDYSIAIFNAMHYRQFYCRSGYHLQIFPNKTVGGTPHDHDRYAILKLITIHKPATVALKGVDTGLFLAMNKYGQLYASPVLNRNCLFKERNVDDEWFSTYSSVKYPSKLNKESRTIEKDRDTERLWYVSLGNKGEPINASFTKSDNKRIHFLQRPVDPKKVPFLYDFPVVEQLERLKPRLERN